MENKFKERLKELRVAKGITQKDLSAELGFSRTTVNDWETQGSEPSFNTLMKVAKYFDVSIDYLLGYRDYE